MRRRERLCCWLDVLEAAYSVVLSLFFALAAGLTLWHAPQEQPPYVVILSCLAGLWVARRALVPGWTPWPFGAPIVSTGADAAALVAASDPAVTGPAARRMRVRTDVKGLRGLAVLLIVLFHCGLVGSGFVGIDVFFVISGYAITSQMLRRAGRGGRVRVPVALARQARRLIPTAVIVTTATVVVARFVAPADEVGRIAGDAVASVLGVMNYRLAALATEGSAVAPLQHFWVVSVEVQFLVVWTVLVAVVAALTGRLRHSLQRAAVALLAVAAIGAGLATMVAFQAEDSPLATLGLTARSWELGVGALAATAAPALRRLPRSVAGLASWAGLVLVLAPAFGGGLSDHYPAPLAAFTVLGALLVVSSGINPARWGAVALLGRRPLQFLGSTAYGWYAWHWPVLVLAPLVFGRALGTSETLAMATLALWLGTVTYVVFERPVRTRPVSPRWLAHGAVGVAAVAVVGAVAVHSLPVPPASSTVAVDATPAHRPARSALPVPPEASAPPATRTMVLFGDEYAASWAGAIRTFANTHGYALTVMTRNGCPVADGGSFGDPECVAWRLDSLADLDALGPDLVVTMQADEPDGATSSDDLWAAQTSATVGRLRAAAAQVVLLQGDPDSPRGQAVARALSTSRVTTTDGAHIRDTLAEIAAP